ncbi:MAG: AraC family transcriptional regulator [Verrucomicrobia bacterium]|nr:AraC family transcriptional regulator [Verrucomicrobiota bacterium]
MKARSSKPRRSRAAPDFFSADVTEAQRFYLNLNPSPEEPLAVVCGGLEHCTPHYAIHRRTFPFCSLEYVARGRGHLRIGGRDCPLQPGRVFSYGPGVRHDITVDPADPLVKYFVDFAGTQSRKLLKDARLAPGRVFQVFPPHEAQDLFDELIHSGLKGARHSANLCARLLECLLLKIAGARAPLEANETRAFTTYQQCRRHIQQHHLRLKTLGQLARECHADAAYLCRLFRRYGHQSPYQFVLRLKMNAAAERLQQPEALVKQVAEYIGFNDPFHFSRSFKREFGLSPDAFRRLR